jgi:hypothetical protein
VRGAAIGALVGAAIALFGVIIINPDSMVEISIGAVIGGAVAGAGVGALIGAFVGLARNPEAWDTYVREHQDESCVAVRAGDRWDRVEVLLRNAGASSVDRT